MAAKCGLALRSEHTRNSFECGDLVLVAAPTIPPLFFLSTSAIGIVTVVVLRDDDQFVDVTTEREEYRGEEEA